MPNLYGKQEDEETDDQGLQPGQSPLAPAGTPSDAASAYQGPESANFTNLENIFSLNKTKAKGFADQATGQVTDALGGLQGRNPPRTGTLRTAEQAAAPFSAAPAQPLRTSQSQVPLAPKKGPLQGQNMTLNQKQQVTLSTLPQESAPAQGQARPTNVDVVPQQPAPGTSEQALESTETRNGTVTELTPAEASAQRLGYDSVIQASNIQKQNEDYIKAQQQAMLAQEEADKATRAQENTDLGKYQKADEMLDSYAADEGQQLLGPGMSALDAELMNQAGGRSAFDDLTKRFRNYDDEFMKQVAGDRGARQIQYEDTQRGLAQAEADRAMLEQQTDSAQEGFESLNGKLNQAPGQAPQTWRDMLAEIDKGTNRTPQAIDNNVTQEGWGADITKSGDFAKLAEYAGLAPDEAQQAWDRFRAELPTDVRNELDSMMLYFSGSRDNMEPKGGWGEEIKFVFKRWQQLLELFHLWLGDQGPTTKTTSN